MRAFLRYLFLLLCFNAFEISFAKAQGVIITIAGTGITEYDGTGSPATNFELALPKSLYVDKKGMVYIANNADGIINTVYHDTLNKIIGDTSRSGDTGDGGLADTAGLKNPDGIFLDTAGNIYITEWFNDLIRKVDAHTNIITTICGITGGGYGGDGGPATAAWLSNPGGACTDIAGNVYIPDYSNHRIRKINAATGGISTIAGTGANAYSGDNGPATNAGLSFPNSVCTDLSGNVYFTEMGNHTVRKIDAATGTITTIAGTGSQGYSPNGTIATSAQLSEPNSVFVDGNAYIYISDYGNDVIRSITPQGLIYTIAGTGAYGYSGDGGPPLGATLRGPTAVFVDDSGYIYIADGYNAVVRKVSPIVQLNVGIKETVKPTFSIYPNPSTGKFTVKPAQQTAGEIRVCNTLGQCVYDTKLTGSSVTIDLSGYAGVYFVQYTTLNELVTKKIVIQ